MNIVNISDLPWAWIWLGALLAFPIVAAGLLEYDKWQERRRVGRYAVLKSAAPAYVAGQDMEILPAISLSGVGWEQPTGTGAVTLAAVVQAGSGVMASSGVGIEVNILGPTLNTQGI